MMESREKEKEEESGSEPHHKGRKRHHRRARKRKQGTCPDRDHEPEQSKLNESTPMLQTFSPPKVSKAVKRGCRKHFRRRNFQKTEREGQGSFSKAPKGFVLRPTEGPLIHAPKNSTQYIIEDHGGDDEGDGNDEPQSDERREPSLSPDDDTYWMQYSERDFQSVYESAHQEEVGGWDRDKLVTEITNLEKRQKELITLLSRMDPEVYLQRLQSRASTILERNRLLKTQLQLRQESISKSEQVSLKSGSDGEASGSICKS